MHVVLTRHTLPGHPDWMVVPREIELGTTFHVVGYDRCCPVDDPTGKKVVLPVYFLESESTEDVLVAPVSCFATKRETDSGN